DRRFRQVAQRSDEAAVVEKRVDELVFRVDATEHRIDEVQESVAAAGERAGEVEALGGRIQAVGKELEAREKALERAMEDLERTTTLRQELAEAIRDLEGQERRVSHAVAAAGEQAPLMAELA